MVGSGVLKSGPLLETTKCMNIKPGWIRECIAYTYLRIYGITLSQLSFWEDSSWTGSARPQIILQEIVGKLCLTFPHLIFHSVVSILL